MSIVNLENKTILVTGAAGFIGSNLVKRIYQEITSATIIGIDSMNDYYDVALKNKTHCIQVNIDLHNLEKKQKESIAFLSNALEIL